MDTIEEIQARAVENGWFEGIPIPLEDLSVVLADTHPLRDELERIGDRRSSKPRACSVDEVDEGETVYGAQWRSSVRRGISYAIVLRRGRAVGVAQTEHNLAMDFTLNTLVASDAWSVEMESRAKDKLHGLVSDRAFRMYLLVDMFIETSQRSGLVYVFRKLRPTIVLTPRNPVDPGNMKILTTLCMHPLGYYAESWAGCMTPTDDVIAHLLMMRGDEHEYWKRAEQHDPWEPEAAIF